jgi:ACR3 family arsenite efflux pump ArsB
MIYCALIIISCKAKIVLSERLHVLPFPIPYNLYTLIRISRQTESTTGANIF